ncbi:hypothetical protein AYI69_g1196 [Smittium culicis]|uniref:Uncharacterized protein n=1 Tax=Smittium culicis TaxID=133412 RepID=A0A1R1YR34_9FUNG|nr:hypothetical protein AYI69_g1196 [Smittium culicis]
MDIDYTTSVTNRSSTNREANSGSKGRVFGGSEAAGSASPAGTKYGQAWCMPAVSSCSADRRVGKHGADDQIHAAAAFGVAKIQERCGTGESEDGRADRIRSAGLGHSWAHPDRWVCVLLAVQAKHQIGDLEMQMSELYMHQPSGLYDASGSSLHSKLAPTISNNMAASSRPNERHNFNNGRNCGLYEPFLKYKESKWCINDNSFVSVNLDSPSVSKFMISASLADISPPVAPANYAGDNIEAKPGHDIDSVKNADLELSGCIHGPGVAHSLNFLALDDSEYEFSYFTGESDISQPVSPIDVRKISSTKVSDIFFSTKTTPKDATSVCDRGGGNAGSLGSTAQCNFKRGKRVDSVSDWRVHGPKQIGLAIDRLLNTPNRKNPKKMMWDGKTLVKKHRHMKNRAAKLDSILGSNNESNWTSQSMSLKRARMMSLVNHQLTSEDPFYLTKPHTANNDPLYVTRPYIASSEYRNDPHIKNNIYAFGFS